MPKIETLEKGLISSFWYDSEDVLYIGTDLVPTIAESEEDPFFHNSDVGRNRFCYYDGRGTDPFATIQMLVGGRNRSWELRHKVTIQRMNWLNSFSGSIIFL